MEAHFHRVGEMGEIRKWGEMDGVSEMWWCLERFIKGVEKATETGSDKGLKSVKKGAVQDIEKAAEEDPRTVLKARR